METPTLSQKNVWGHLQDLQTWILWAVATWVLASVVVSFFSDSILAFLQAPIKGQTLFLHSPTDSLMFLFKIFGLGGLVISLPVQVWLLWRFVSPAFDRKEQQFGIFYILAICVLSLIGLGYGYYSLIPASLKFLLELSPKGTQLMLTAGEYVDFLMMLLVLIVLVFQTPILVFGLIRARIVEPESFAKHRKVVYFALVVGLCMVLPPDLVLLFMTVLPIILLYEASILLGKFSLKNSKNPSKAISEIIPTVSNSD